jgi:hypothetical protein
VENVALSRVNYSLGSRTKIPTISPFSASSSFLVTSGHLPHQSSLSSSTLFLLPFIFPQQVFTTPNAPLEFPPHAKPDTFEPLFSIASLSSPRQLHPRGDSLRIPPVGEPDRSYFYGKHEEASGNSGDSTVTKLDEGTRCWRS